MAVAASLGVALLAIVGRQVGGYYHSPIMPMSQLLRIPLLVDGSGKPGHLTLQWRQPQQQRE